MLVLISFLHHWEQSESERERESGRKRKRGGGPRPVGKVKLPAAELCIKPFLWQHKLSTAYAHNTVPSLPLFLLLSSSLHIPEVTAVFSSVSHVVGIIIYWLCMHANGRIYLASCQRVVKTSTPLYWAPLSQKYPLLKKSCFSLSLSLLLALRLAVLGGREIIETGCSILSADSSRCEHPDLLVNGLEK